MMPTSSFSQSRIAAMKNVLADWRWTQRGGGGWSVGAAGPVQQPDCVGSGVKGEGGGMLNSSSLYTLLYSVIYNSVLISDFFLLIL